MKRPDIPQSLIPHTKLQTRKENVLDARICILSGCRFFRRHESSSGRAIGSCSAGVFRADLPLPPLEQEISKNPSPVPGLHADENPFLLRLLMSPDCVRPECGVAEITHQERVLVPDPEEQLDTLFAS